jgi:hypothetical protein
MSVWSRACVPVTHFILLPLGPTSPLTTWRQRMPCMHARTACTAYSTGLEGRRTKGETLCPCHVSPSPTLLATGSYQCDCNRGVSPLSSLSVLVFERNFSPGSVLPRGAAVCTATATGNAWTSSSLLSIHRCLDPWLLCRNVYRLVALDTTSPHILPLGGAETKNLVRST